MSEQHIIADTQHTKSKKLFLFYVIGCILSVILTVGAFLLVENKALDADGLYVSVMVLAIAQFLVQIFCFLRLNARTEHYKWNLIAFIFTLIIISIVVIGSLWIMYNLNYNMVN